MAKIILTPTEQNIYENLRKQIVKISIHNRQGSFQTKDTYQAAVQRFCKYLAKEFKTQKFANIQDKHLESYIKFMQGDNRDPGYIKNSLCAIRFYHDKCQNAKYTLSDNSAFELESRVIGGKKRAWSNKSYEMYLRLLKKKGRKRDFSIAVLARELGLRIHETLWIDRATAEQALRENKIHIKGKNGKWRYIPLTDVSRQILFESMQDINRGEKLYIGKDKKGKKENTDLVIKQVQNYINKHRKEFMFENEDHEDITFHGLRHKYAQERYEYFRLKEKKNHYEACLEVSALLGHERDEVTEIYLY